MKTAKTIHLTNREKQIIILICEEYNCREIGEFLGMGRRTVETHKRNIFKKLKVKNVVGLVLYACRHRIYKI